MIKRLCPLAAVVALSAGCADRPDPATGNAVAGMDVEAVVRAAIGQQFRVDPAAIDMDRPLSDPPLKADELDLVELIMEIEDRLGVEISDAEVERVGGIKPGGPIRLTPADLVRLARTAKPAKAPKGR